MNVLINEPNKFSKIMSNHIFAILGNNLIPFWSHSHKGFKYKFHSRTQKLSNQNYPIRMLYFFVVLIGCFSSMSTKLFLEVLFTFGLDYCKIIISIHHQMTS